MFDYSGDSVPDVPVVRYRIEAGEYKTLRGRVIISEICHRSSNVWQV